MSHTQHKQCPFVLVVIDLGLLQRDHLHGDHKSLCGGYGTDHLQPHKGPSRSATHFFDIAPESGCFNMGVQATTGALIAPELNCADMHE
jgi:hypothetical protein